MSQTKWTRVSRRAAVGITAVATAVLASGLAGTGAAQAAARAGHHAGAETPASHVTIAGSAPAWVATAKVVGSPAASSRITFNVVLPLRHAAALGKLALAVSDPKSASYGHYLTPAQFNQQFGPTAAQAASVRGYLAGLGFAVKGVAEGNRWVTVSGTVRRVESAFGTTLRNYSYKGKTLRAASRPLSVAASMSKLIAGFVGAAPKARRAGPPRP